jgi:hypothetical protein
MQTKYSRLQYHANQQQACGVDMSLQNIIMAANRKEQ